MITIYGLSDPDTDVVQYIGQTVNLKRRVIQHVSEAEKFAIEKKYPKDRWIAKLKRDGKRPSVVVIERVRTADRANLREIFWIKKYRKVNPNLKNISDGGATPRLKRTKEWQRKIAETKIRNGKTRYGRMFPCPICGKEYYLTRAEDSYGRLACSRKCAVKLPGSVESYKRNLKPPPKKKYCKRGHPLSGKNLRILTRKDEVWRSKIERICRECVRIRNRASKVRTRKIKCQLK